MKRFTGLGGFADVDALSSPHTQGSDAGYLYQPSRFYSLGCAACSKQMVSKHCKAQTIPKLQCIAAAHQVNDNNPGS